MKKTFLLLLVIPIAVFSCFSCHKTPQQAANPLIGKNWTATTDSTLHLRFTTDTLHFTWGTVNASSSDYYVPLTNDTLFFPFTPGHVVAKVVGDTLYYNAVDVTNGISLKLYNK